MRWSTGPSRRSAAIVAARPPTRDSRARGPGGRGRRVFAVDANCLVATVSAWHEHHQVVSRELSRRLTAGEEMVVPVPSLTEAFSVLTRMPKPQRLSPPDAWRSLDASFVALGRIHALDGEAAITLLARSASAGVGGGRIYDVIIGECARLAGAGALVTLNPKHFEPPPAGIAVIDPLRPPSS